MKRLYVIMFIITLLTPFNLLYAGNEYGSYEGNLITEVLPDGRNLRVIKPLTYIDPKHEKWLVPAGEVTDGASVPRFFWVIFPPFTGKYRIAAVIHDRYCRTRSRPWRNVHRMFYNAMLAAGVDFVSAKTMYGAVYSFGPRWSMGGKRAPKRSQLNDEQQKAAFYELKRWIEEKNPSTTEIERHVNRKQLRQLGLNR